MARLQLNSLLGALLTLLPATIASALPDVPLKQGLPISTTIYQPAQNGTWIENIVHLPDNDLLLTRVDVPELWRLNPSTREAKLLHNFAETGVNSLAGITQLQPNLFAILGARFDLVPAPKLYPGSGKVFLADLTDSQKPRFTTAKNISDSLLPNGAATFDKDTIIIADSVLGVLYRLNVFTGALGLVSNDTLLKSTPEQLVGVNGVKVWSPPVSSYAEGKKEQKYLYFTSSAQELFARIPLTPSAAPAGPIEIIAANVGSFFDDFILDSRDGSALAATNTNNTVLRISAEGKVTRVLGSQDSFTVAGATALAWGENGEVFVTTAGATINGVTQGGKVVKVVGLK
jgi:hypothetical protein